VSDRWWAVALRFLAGFIVTAAVVTAATGCAAGEKAAAAAKYGAQALKSAEPILVAHYDFELELCRSLPLPEADECTSQVRARYEPVKSSIRVFRDAWCAVDEAIGEQECRDAE
jgi:hypothetical protein